MARLMGKAREVKAGTYQLTGPITAVGSAYQLRLGDAVKSEITFIEGSTFTQIRKVLAEHAGLKPESMGLSDEALLKLIGAKEANPEGLFFPDTYVFSGGVSDVAILKPSLSTDADNARKGMGKTQPGTSL